VSVEEDPRVGERIVLAYSGGLDTSVAIRWLAERCAAEVVTVTVDLGQRTELADVRERALAIGAVRAHVVDAREEFARDYVLPALQAGASCDPRYPVATALGRPLIARHLVRIAEMEGAQAIAHGCSGRGNDPSRLEVSARALDPSIRILAPAREWGMTRSEEVEYARRCNIPITAAAESGWRTDANLWGRSVEGGALEDSWAEPPEEVYALTRAPAHRPETPACIELAFERGVPVAINGVAMGLTELVASLETIAGAHGVGRFDLIENRPAGIQSRVIGEAPAAIVLHLAHRELEALVVPPDLERLKHQLGRAYADLVHDGLWFTPTREAIDAFVAAVQPRVTGEVRLKVSQGDCRVVGRRSPFALHGRTLAAGDAAGRSDCAPADATMEMRKLAAGTARRAAAQEPVPAGGPGGRA
jgi:argininosuccinate synthase